MLVIVAPLFIYVTGGSAPIGLVRAMGILSVQKRPSYLVVTKSAFQSAAVAQLIGTGVNVTCEGQPYLGAAIGTQEYIRMIRLQNGC